MRSPWEDIGAALNKVPFIVWVAILLLAAMFGVFIWNETTFKQHIPALPRGELLYAMATVYQKQGGYPETVEPFIQASQTFKSRAKKFGEGGFVCGNYFYRYHQLDKENAVLWAFPQGRLRLKSKSYLFVCRNGKINIWKGEAIENLADEERIAKINKPTFELLAQIGMQEVKKISSNEILETAGK